MAYKNINAQEFEKILEENSNAVLLDVRTPVEVRQGKIDGALHIDVMDRQFIDKIDKLDKSKTYLVYCRSGNRSGQACRLMSGKGFKDLYNLTGGISRWPHSV